MKSLGERCIDVAYKEMSRGVKSDNAYPGKNTSSAIREYLGPCVRDVDRDGDLELLGLKSGNWCAAGACWCLSEANYATPVGDPDYEIPHEYRAGVVEMVYDAKQNGVWVPKSEWDRDTVQRGDLAIWDRSKPGGPQWFRHVNRVLTWSGAVLKTIGGNENGRQWNVRETNSFDKLLGFIQYPRLPEKPKPLFSDAERAEIRAQIDACHAEIVPNWRSS